MNELHVVTDQALADRQSRRLLRPLLAFLAVKFATENHQPPNLYGGALAFEQPTADGPAWIVGEFDNRPGYLTLTLRRSDSPPDVSEFLRCEAGLGRRAAFEKYLATVPDVPPPEHDRIQ